jgi:tellurite methyltransferase
VTEGHWEKYWSSASNLDWWERPAQEVVDLTKIFTPGTHPNVLDLGCGIGRHALMFAHKGYSVTATDESPSAIERVELDANEQSVSIDTKICEMLDQGFEAGTFDLILAYNVIYHGRRQEFAEAISHIDGLLRPSGVFFFTCPTRRDGKYGHGKLVAPHAYESPNSVTPGDLHYFPDRSDLDDLLDSFNVLSIVRDEGNWDNKGNVQFYSNWQVLVEKPYSNP